MSTTIGSFTTSKLLVQPFGYEETDTRSGLTAQKLRMSGLLTPDEWQDLVAEYDSWRDSRINDPDSVAANDVGTTVDVSVSANGVSWSAVPCWFISAPSAEQTGAYVSATVELVDAEQALEVALRQKEKAKQAEDRPDLGTFSLGGCTLTLLKPPNTYQDMPQMALTAAGTTYITGPLGATTVYALEGETDSAGWGALQEWFDGAVASRPSGGSYFPVSAPSAVAKNDVIDGVKVVTYTVSISVGVAK